MEGLFKNKYKIPSSRLSGYDYASFGFYFITICTHERAHYFGDVLRDDGGECSMALSDIGKIARDELLKTAQIRPNVELDEWIIMPNHIHVIFVITSSGGFVETPRGKNIVETCGRMNCRDVARNVSTGDINIMSHISPKPGSLSTIVRSFKSAVSNKCNHRNFDFHWQTRFYDHIIRTEKSLQKIRQYIRMNPYLWHRDRNNSEGLLM